MRYVVLGFLAVDLLVAANQQAWSRMLDNTQGGHGDAEAVFAFLLCVLAGVVVGIATVRRGKLKALGAALTVPAVMLILSWYLGDAATRLLRSHYCAEIRSPGQCGRCFEGEEARLRCGG